MSNNLGSLVVSLGLDAGQFTKGLSKSEYQAQQWARKFEAGIEAARTAALGSFAAMSGAVLALDNQLQSMAGFQDLADKMGDTAQEVASLKLAADVSGVSIESIAGASVKLTAALSKLDDESKGAGNALGAIGLNFEEFKRLAPVAQIDAVAKAMAGFEDGAGKTAVAVALFGKSGADLIPLLNDLAEQGGRQVSLTGDQIAAADEYSKALARLSSEVRTLVSVTAADAAPALTQMVQILRDINTYASAGASGFSLLSAVIDGAKVVLQTVVVLGSEVAFVFRQTGIEIGGMAAQLAALTRMDFSGFRGISEAMKQDAARARAELDAFQARVLSSGLAAGSQASYSNEGRNYGGAKKVLQFSAAPPAKIDAPKASANADPLGDFLKDPAIQATMARQAAMEREAQRTYENTRSAIEQLNIREAELQKLKEQGYITDDIYWRAREAADDKYQASLDKTPEKIVAIDQATKDAEERAKRLGDAFSSTFDSAFRNGMKFGDLLKKLAFDAINIQLLTPAAQKAGSALGGIVSSGLGSLFGGFRANGGPVSAGKGYVVGERGPEWFSPASSGMITPNHALGGAGSSIIQHITIDARGADAGVDARIRAAMAQSKQETLAAVQSGANRGGGFARALGRA